MNPSLQFRGKRLVLVLVVVLLFACRASSARAQSGAPATVSPPTVVTHVDARYPPAALAARAQADVVLAVTVDTEGRVSAVEVLASGGPDLDQAAEVAVRQWTFVAANRDGKAVASRIRVPFHFAPKDALPEPLSAVVAPKPGANPASPAQPSAPALAPTGARSDGSTSGAPGPVEVRVAGRRPPPSRGASDFNMRVGELSRVPRQNASELLKLAPGILLTNEGGDGHAEQVFLRGFDARAGQDIEFSAGGVPINESGNLHGNGYADTHFIIPELVESLRVLEGPFDPRQGNYAVAGSANYELGLAKRGLTLKYTRGTFGTERALALWGPPGQGEHTFGGAEVYRTDGFGQNRDAERGSAMAQYEGTLGPSGTFRVLGQAYSNNYHTAGILRDDDYHAGRKGFFDTYDFGQGGQSTRFSLSGDIETRVDKTTLGQQVFLIYRKMRLRENFTGFLLDEQSPLQDPHPQRGDLLDVSVPETTVGAKGYARTTLDAWNQRHEFELGYFARFDNAGATQQRIGAQNNFPYKTEVNLDSTLVDIGVYGDANLRPTSWLSVRGGFRADVLTYDVDNLCAANSVRFPNAADPPGNSNCLSQADFGRYRDPNQRNGTSSNALMPRVTVLFGPFAHFTLSASYGLGVRSIDPIYISQDLKTPFASIRSYEGGVSYAATVGDVEILARSIFFQTHVDKDLVFSETAGRNTLANGTTRTGWVGAVRATGSFFDEAANVTVVRSTFDDTHLLVPYVPDLVLRSDSAVFADLPFRISGEPVRGTVSAGVSYIGRRALPYGERSDTIFTIDASTTLGWSVFEVGLMATNLLGTRYRLGEYNYASDFHTAPNPTLVPVRHFTAGMPRAIYGTLSITLGGA